MKSVVKGDKVTVSTGDKVVAEVTITVDPSKKPKWMDSVTTGEDKKALAIYELDGDTLKICVGLKGERPKEFTGKKDSGCALYVYKREKK
jgi:uncharacterized protein (TIGR03067 family)